MQRLPENDLVFLLTVLESIGKIDLYSADFTDPVEFYQAQDQLNFNASLLLIANIGEQCGKISDLTRNKCNIDWKNVRGMRNRIVHDYAGIDYEITFNIVKKELPALKKEIEDVIFIGLTKGTFLAAEIDIARNSLWYRHVNFAALI